MDRLSPEISPEDIRPHVQSISNNRFMKTLYKRRGQPTDKLGDFFVRSIPEDNGDGITTHGHRTATTTKRLVGSVHSLNNKSLVLFESFVIPAEINKASVEDLVYGRPLATVAISRILIDEPGFFNPSKYEFDGFFQTDVKGEEVAINGLARFLNYSEDHFLDSEESSDSIMRTAKLIGNVLSDERRFIDYLEQQFRNSTDT